MSPRMTCMCVVLSLVYCPTSLIGKEKKNVDRRLRFMCGLSGRACMIISGVETGAFEGSCVSNGPSTDGRDLVLMGIGVCNGS